MVDFNINKNNIVYNNNVNFKGKNEMQNDNKKEFDNMYIIDGIYNEDDYEGYLTFHTNTHNKKLVAHFNILDKSNLAKYEIGNKIPGELSISDIFGCKKVSPVELDSIIQESGLNTNTEIIGSITDKNSDGDFIITSKGIPIVSCLTDDILNPKINDKIYIKGLLDIDIE